jgi:hypothetical protein
MITSESRTSQRGNLMKKIFGMTAHGYYFSSAEIQKDI